MTTIWIPSENDVLQAMYRLGGRSTLKEITLETRGQPPSNGERGQVAARIESLIIKGKVRQIRHTLRKPSKTGETITSYYAKFFEVVQ